MKMRHRRSPLALVVRAALFGGSMFAGASGAVNEAALADHYSNSPVQIYDRTDIDQTGLLFVSDFLQQLVNSGSARNSAFNGGGDGQTQVDLRNLGSSRTLVLLNGRRLSSGLGGGVDLNGIPLTIIDRIEVLPQGSGAVFGSDAVAGVINLITRDEVAGMELTAQVGQFGSENDGEGQSVGLAVGSQSDRGSAFFSASYTRQESVLAGDRRISAEPVFGTGNAFGSIATPQGRFGGARLGSFGLTVANDPANSNAVIFPEGDFSTGAPGSGADRYNFAPASFLLTPIEQTGVFTSAEYQMSDDINLRLEGLYNNRQSSQQFAPAQLFLGQFAAGSVGQDVSIPASHPFNPFAVDLEGSSFLLARRLVEAGNRVFSQDVDHYRFGVDLEGQIQWSDRPFQWQIGYRFDRVDERDQAVGQPNVSRVVDALSLQCIDGTLAGCVPLNLFGGQGPDGNGTITQSMLDYILATQNSQSESTLREYHAGISGQPITLTAGPIDLNAEYIHREEEGSFFPDALVASGATGGVSRNPTVGSESVDEFALGVNVPLVRLSDGRDLLSVAAAFRYSDYDTFGDTTNGQVSLSWQPMDEVTFSLGAAEVFNAPSLSDRFAGTLNTQQVVADPCADLLGLSGNAPADAAVVTNCIAQGVPADGSYSQNSPVLPTSGGGNPALAPETGNSYWASIGYAPRQVSGLDVVLNYYDVDLDDVLIPIGAQQILNNCANSGRFCDQVIRNPSTGALVNVAGTTVNAASRSVAGIDAAIRYQTDLGAAGDIAFDWLTAYQRKNDSLEPEFNPGTQAPTESLLGTSGFNSGFPRWKSSLETVWSTGPWQVAHELEYRHGTTEPCSLPTVYGFCNVDTDSSGINNARRIGATTYHDVQVAYQWADIDTTIVFGVRNLFDKNPPLSTVSGQNSFSVADYRVPGRFPYLRVTVDW